MGYDAILIHPPAIYDFRKKVTFPGPIAYTVSESTDQFMIPPIGMLSIADYLNRNGYRAMVDNICERMVTDEDLNVEEYINNLSTRVFAIGLNWCVHSQGAIEIAKICKKLHPEAMVILGGLTATVFSEEMLSKYESVDAVIRGEAEKPFLWLMTALGQNDKLKEIPSLTFRDSEGKIISNPLMKPVDTLDEFEFTRLDLIEPKKTIFPPNMSPRWYIPICRGCVYNCATCGGSKYSYKTYLGREKPAFRSPEKIAEDIHRLNRQGIQRIFLFQDPRMGGREYWRRLLSVLRSEKIKQIQITMELFGPADDEYIKQLANTGVPIVLSISPESCVDSVRKAHGRKYDNKELLRTVRLCKKYNIPIGIFSMIALAEDTRETIKETWKIWEQICLINQEVKDKSPAHYAFGPMILLDPGSCAFDFPNKYGYRLIFKNLEGYIQGMSLPSWHQWISYETKFLSRDSITQLIIDSIEYSINLREKYGLYSECEADIDRLRFITINKIVVDVVNEAMNIQDEDERLKALGSFRESLNELLITKIPDLEYN